MKKNNFYITCISISLLSLASNKKLNDHINKYFADISNIEGKINETQLFKRTVLAQSFYTEYISLYNLQKTKKNIRRKYEDNLQNYQVILDSLQVSMQASTPGFRDKCLKTMSYIIADIQDKSGKPCLICSVSDYHPLLIAFKINISHKSNSTVGIKAYMKPYLSYSSDSIINFDNTYTESIVPGFYKIWIEKNGHKIQERDVHVKNQLKTEIFTFLI